MNAPNENERSFSSLGAMSTTDTATTARQVADPLSERALRILAAAERCFVKNGFHRSTMGDVAAEAGMSPGNIYRYFASKDALVAGLIEQDRLRVCDELTDILSSDNFMDNLVDLGRKYFIDEDKDRLILTIEIWAEATRNPETARLLEGYEQEMRNQFIAFMDNAKERGHLPAGADSARLERLVSIFASGLIVRRCVISDFEPEVELGMMVDAFKGMLKEAEAGEAAQQEFQA